MMNLLGHDWNSPFAFRRVPRRLGIRIVFQAGSIAIILFAGKKKGHRLVWWLFVVGGVAVASSNHVNHY